MREVRAGAARFAAGDFATKLSVPKTEEFAAVAESLNAMAEELDAKIRTITRERNEREAVLASMIEGVLAVDPDGHVIAMNDSAVRLLQVEAGDARGRAIEEVVRNPALQHIVAEALAGRGPIESDLMAHLGHEERFLQANGAQLRAGEEIVGAVVVLNDVTRLRRLEAVRRDFVANVSHELKTPVTSIKGFTETLLDGAVDDPVAGPRFLRIIAGQAERLNSIIEDLLALSALEGTDEGMVPPLQEAAIEDVLHVAADVCGPRAEAKHVTIEVDAPADLMVKMNPALLEQAVVNLIDNAVKYGPEGGIVRVGAERRGAEAVVTVADDGPGIPREHLSRLFERFCRVDKARSRDIGGTGLGLSIVKHIAQVHGGRVSVESTVGRGSVFRLHLRSAD
jgi:two-component system phosphate regulon sensor histidine kinase PhoR